MKTFILKSCYCVSNISSAQQDRPPGISFCFSRYNSKLIKKCGTSFPQFLELHGQMLSTLCTVSSSLEFTFDYYYVSWFSNRLLLFGLHSRSISVKGWLANCLSASWNIGRNLLCLQKFASLKHQEVFFCGFFYNMGINYPMKYIKVPTCQWDKWAGGHLWKLCVMAIHFASASGHIFLSVRGEGAEDISYNLLIVLCFLLGTANHKDKIKSLFIVSLRWTAALPFF